MTRNFRLKEKDIQSAHLEKLNYYPNIKMWRNNVGVFKVDKRYIRTGLCVGSADLIGFESKVVTQDMLGKRVAIFRADEIKRPGQEPKEHQQEWLEMCAKLGAIVNVITDPSA